MGPALSDMLCAFLRARLGVLEVLAGHLQAGRLLLAAERGLPAEAPAKEAAEEPLAVVSQFGGFRCHASLPVWTYLEWTKLWLL